jgi:hypothetical protein
MSFIVGQFIYRMEKYHVLSMSFIDVQIIHGMEWISTSEVVPDCSTTSIQWNEDGSALCLHNVLL